MKKLFFAMAAMAAMLTSCSKDDTTTAPVIERSQVTFTVNAPELSTRADEGNGTTATKLEYVIYDLAEAEGDNEIYGTADFVNDNDNNPLTTTVEVNLVEGREYEAIFFAHAEGAPYTIDWTAQTMTLNTQGLTANNEKYDAFFKYVEPFEITEQQYSVDVKMKRPFAQLNVATVDYNNDAYPAGKMIDADMTGVEVEAYKSMNLKTGNVEGAKEIIKYNVASSSTLKQNDPIKVDNVDYTWLSMNYILVNARENVGVKFYFTDKDATSTKTYTREYTQVPVERNFRTNIVGTILTSPTEFNVEIKPEFLGTEIYDADNTQKVTTNATSLQATIDAAVDAKTDPNDENYNPDLNTVIITFTEDMNASNAGSSSIRANNSLTTRAGEQYLTINIQQIEGLNYVIDGAGYKFDGTFIIDGNSRNTGTETLTFKNINFEHSVGAIDFIDSDSAADGVRYAHNVTVDNCTFTGNANGAVVAARLRQAYNVRFVNCVSGSGMHSFGQLASMNDGLIFDNVTIENATEGGINLLSSAKDVIIANSDINGTLYGVRVDGKQDGKLVIENSSIEATTVPIVIREVAAAYNVELKGNNTITTDQKYDVIFTKGAFGNANALKTLVAPESNWKLTGAEGLNVFPGDIVITNLEELKAFRDAVNAGTTYSGATVKLDADINLNNEEWTPIGNSAHAFQGTFDGQNHVISNLSINTPKNSYVGLFGNTNSGEIKNLIVENAKITGRMNVGVVAGQPYTSKFNNITVKGHVEVYGMSYVGGVGGKNAYADWNNVTVAADETSYVKANSVEGDKAYRTYVGGVVGFNGEGGHTFKNITSNIDVEGSTIDVGGMFGIAHYGNKFENCSSSGDVEIYAAEEAEAAEEIGGIAGVWHNGGEDVTFTNCSFTGNLSVNVEGVDLSDNTIVGKPYSSSGKGSLWVNGTYAYVGSADALATAAKKGFTNIDLADGEYDVYGCAGKTLTLNGSVNAILKLKNEGEDGCDYAFGGNGTGVGNITFNGLTIDTTSNTGNYKGFAYMKGTFNNCNFVGAYSLNNDNDFVFNNCTFDFQNGYFWTWGAKSVKFDGCTFNGNSKNILAHGYASTVITINNCNFAATEVGKTGAGDPTACVEIDPAGTNTYTINFTGTNTKTEYYAGWTRIKDNSTGHTITGVE